MLKSLLRRSAVAGCVVGLSIALLTGCSLFPQPPVASFVINYNTTSDPLLVVLDASASVDPDGGAIITYMWAFLTADPEGPEILDPLAFSAVRSTPNLQIRYPAEDSSTIQLVVVDESGAMSEPLIKQITVPNVEVGPTQ
ncbi:MAG: hypothetical protein E4H08_00440 [Candidatus Atribacteria bacterium]|jgi:hypothetical protein|nr:MAG: hypothetical protein E4H08_00440 [Candidatus Atribacteria bacterium]